MARCKHYVEAFDCCAKISEFIEDVLWVKSCYYKDDVCPNCRYFEEKADVVPVVRCKDCIYYEPKNSLGTQGICQCGEKEMNYGGEFYPLQNDYCSYGERRC